MTHRTTTTLDHLPSERKERVACGLALLDDAYGDAADTGYDVWQFAVRLGEVHAVGMTSGDVRWLIAHSVVLHAVERSYIESEERTFVPCPNLELCDSSSLVLRADAVPVVHGWCAAVRGRPTAAVQNRPNRPWWDGMRRELYCVGVLVKRFRVPAPSQELVLTVFEEEGWPIHIDDPLPPDPKFDPAQRLHDAVRGLNRNQRPRLIRFERDGRGKGVRWSAVPMV